MPFLERFLSLSARPLLISVNALVVPLRALNTTMVGSSLCITRSPTCCIFSGLPMQVPPNFITFILLCVKVANIVAETGLVLCLLAGSVSGFGIPLRALK